MGSHSPPLLLGASQQTPARWGSRTGWTVRCHTPSICRSTCRHRPLATLSCRGLRFVHMMLTPSMPGTLELKSGF